MTDYIPKPLRDCIENMSLEELLDLRNWCANEPFGSVLIDELAKECLDEQRTD